MVVEQGDQPNQLRVTVSTTVRNFFIGLVGLPRQTITRTAVAEFEGPVPMGSPANNLGNQPIATGDLDWGSGLSDPESANPEVWAQIAGAGTNKHNGDRFTANLCGSTSLPVYACAGSNTEYADAGGTSTRCGCGWGRPTWARPWPLRSTTPPSCSRATTATTSTASAGRPRRRRCARRWPASAPATTR